MKKLFIASLAIFLSFMLCACGSEKVDPSPEQNTTVVTNGNAPTQKQLQADIGKALSEHNQYVSVTGIETEKSLTNENSFTATLNITAESKYADWTYTADLAYTKYDQGWIIDNVAWATENYIVQRFPDSVTMVEYASTYLPNHELVQKYSSLREYMFPIENATVEYKYCSELGSDALCLNWHTVQNGNFINMICPFTSFWEYDETIDNWTIMPNDESGSSGYHLNDEHHEFIPIENLENLDFSGSWDDYVQFVKEIPVNITISEYSSEGFDARIEWRSYNIIEKELSPPQIAYGHFTRTYENLGNISPKDTLWIFDDGDNNYIPFSFGYDLAQLNYYIDGASSGVRVDIEDQLPLLP